MRSSSGRSTKAMRAPLRATYGTVDANSGQSEPPDRTWHRDAMEPLSGRRVRLRAGDYQATIASIGASLRELTWQGRNLVVPFAEDEVRPAYRGAVLAPWPNRVVDGRYQ